MLKMCIHVRGQIRPVTRKYTEICIQTSPSLKESNPLGMRHTCSRNKEKKEEEEEEEMPFKYSLTA